MNEEINDIQQNLEETKEILEARKHGLEHEKAMLVETLPKIRKKYQIKKMATITALVIVAIELCLSPISLCLANKFGKDQNKILKENSSDVIIEEIETNLILKANERLKAKEISLSEYKSTVSNANDTAKETFIVQHLSEEDREEYNKLEDKQKSAINLAIAGFSSSFATVFISGGLCVATEGEKSNLRRTVRKIMAITDELTDLNEIKDEEVSEEI